MSQSLSVQFHRTQSFHLIVISNQFHGLLNHVISSLLHLCLVDEWFIFIRVNSDLAFSLLIEWRMTLISDTAYLIPELLGKKLLDVIRLIVFKTKLGS